MFVKLVVASVLRSIPSWLALIVASAAFSAILVLNIGLIVVGAGSNGEAQQAYVAVGGVALGFNVLAGMTSLVMVAGVCIRLQSRSVALWHLAGVLPRTSFRVLLAEVSLVCTAASLAGALCASALWWPLVTVIRSSGLPTSDLLHQAISLWAIVAGFLTAAAVGVLSGGLSARRVSRASPLDGLSKQSGYKNRSASMISRILRILMGIAAAVAVAFIYLAISRVKPMNKEKLGDFLTSYAGMGILVCVVAALLGGGAVWLIVRLLAYAGLSFTGKMPPAWMLAIGEASARPALTRALVMPIAVAAAAIGVILAWIRKLSSILAPVGGSSDSVTAPPGQMALLVGGPVIISCVAAASVVFATAADRRRDILLLIVGGATARIVYLKVLLEIAIYTVAALTISYLVMGINEFAMVAALAAGPVPSASLSWPPWHAAGVVVLGMAVAVAMMSVITVGGVRQRDIVSEIGGD